MNAMNAKGVQGVQGIHNALTDALDPSKGAGTLLDWLQKKPKPVLWYVLCDVGRPSNGPALNVGKSYSQYTRAELAAIIVDWVSSCVFAVLTAI